MRDDGDALRLAVKLRMMISPDDYGYEVKADSYSGHHWTEFCEGDELAATRRAIVNLAAMIGRHCKAK